MCHGRGDRQFEWTIIKTVKYALIGVQLKLQGLGLDHNELGNL